MTEGEDTSAALVLIRSGDLSRPTAVEITTASGSADGNIIIIAKEFMWLIGAIEKLTCIFSVKLSTPTVSIH